MSRPVHVLKDRYELHKKIARGGMAEVFLARDRVLDRPVAVKIMFPEFATDPTFVERFRREAQSAARLNHPNIVGVYDWGEERGTYFLVMEYINGPSVSEVLRRDGPLSPRQAADIASDVASALGAAHEVGVIHRDIKPGNIMLTPDNRAKVTDFGIARLAHDPENELTKVGSVMGTATYFSPEQAQGFALDGRSDLYSLGGVLFEMLTGRPPFAADSPVAIAYKHVQERPPRPASIVPGIPLAIEAITLRLLTKNPESRYDNAQQLVADLRRFRMGQPTIAEMALQRSAEPDQDAVGTQAQPVTTVNGSQFQSGVVSERTRVAASAVAPADEDANRNKLVTYSVAIALLVAVLGGLAFFLSSTLGDDPPVESTMVVIPKLEGRPQAEGLANLKARGLEPVVELRADAAIAKDSIISTSPPAGDRVKDGAKVTVYVSSGPPQSNIPLVRDRNVDDAKALLAKAGFLNVTVELVESAEASPGIVIDQTPAANTAAAPTVAIVLKVADAPKEIDIPDVAGMTETKATNVLTAAGFKVGSVTRRTDSSVAAGRAIGTDPKNTATQGSTLDLIISSGPESVAVPRVVGLSEADAKAALIAAGFSPDVTSKAVPAGSSDDGKVISVSPLEGESLPTGSSVSITVARAEAPTTTASTTTTTAPTTSTSPPTSSTTTSSSTSSSSSSTSVTSSSTTTTA